MGTSAQFAHPAPPGEGIHWVDLHGHLLIVMVHEVETGIQTVHGVTGAVRADVADVDTGTVHRDTLVFPKVLRAQLGRLVGQTVLGRLSQGQAKTGQSAPWMLAEASTEEQARASQWLAARRDGTAPPQPPPVPVPVPAPAAASIPF